MFRICTIQHRLCNISLPREGASHTKPLPQHCIARRFLICFQVAALIARLPGVLAIGVMQNSHLCKRKPLAIRIIAFVSPVTTSCVMKVVPRICLIPCKWQQGASWKFGIPRKCGDTCIVCNIVVSASIQLHAVL